MRTAAHRANARKLILMAALVLLAAAAYLLVEVNPKYFSYAMSLRIPKLIVMLIAAFPSAGRPSCSNASSITPSSPLAC